MSEPKCICKITYDYDLNVREIEFCILHREAEAMLAEMKKEIEYHVALAAAGSAFFSRERLDSLGVIVARIERGE